jgi:hypothetical protein
MAALYDRIDNDVWLGAILVPLVALFPVGMILLTLGLWRSGLAPWWALAPVVLASLAEILHVPSAEQIIAVLAPVTSLIIAGSLVALSRRSEAGAITQRTAVTAS